MINGLDLSGDFQNVSSFHRVHAAGYGFVAVKASEGQHFTAGRFGEYRDRIRSVDGLHFGAYHFLSWNVDGKAQAEHFLSVYQPGNGDLLPMLDCEAFTVGADEATQTMADFLGVLDPHLGGAKPFIYTYYSALVERRFHPDWFTDWPLWIAEYNGDAQPTIPPGTWDAATIWQYSDGAGLPMPPGISGSGCDRDRFLGDQLDSIILKGL